MSRKTLIVLLILSLAVNVFMIGAVVGGLVVGHKSRGDRPMMGRGGPPLWAAANDLSEAQRRDYRRLLRGEAGEVREGMRAARAARTQAWADLGAEPMDAAAVKASLDRARAAEMAARGEVEARIVDFAGRLPPKDRATLSEGLRRSQPGPQEKRGPRREGPSDRP